MGPEKEATAFFYVRVYDLGKVLLTKNLYKGKKPKHSTSGNAFWFPKAEGMTREDFVFILNSILLRITEYFDLQRDPEGSSPALM